MKAISIVLVTILSVACLLAVVDVSGVQAQPPGKGKGKGFGKGGGGGPGMQADREIFHFLLDNRKDIRRTITKLDDGVETLTESDKAEVTKKIQEHVESMHRRVSNGQGIHLRDPLFAEIFRYYDKIVMKIEKTAKGVKVKETSKDPYVIQLIQAHAEVVSKFIANGYDEVHRNHSLPKAK